MSDYKIKSIGKVDFREYKDVVRVIATKKRGFWTSLFSSPIEAYFILSEDSQFGMFQKLPLLSKE